MEHLLFAMFGAALPSCEYEDASNLLYTKQYACSWNYHNTTTEQDGNGKGDHYIVIKFSETKGWADLGYFYPDDPQLNEVVRVYK